jgi:hypothetical protein
MQAGNFSDTINGYRTLPNSMNITSVMEGYSWHQTSPSTMKAQRVSTGTAQLILNPATRWRWMVHLTQASSLLGNHHPCFTPSSMLGGPEPVWKFWTTNPRTSSPQTHNNIHNILHFTKTPCHIRIFPYLWLFQWVIGAVILIMTSGYTALTSLSTNSWKTAAISGLNVSCMHM